MTSARNTMKVEARSRPFEILLGIVVAVAALVPLTFIAGAVLVSAGSPAARWDVLVGGPVATVVFIWCARTAWRLITGQPRRDGGLLSPWFIASAGVGFTALSMYFLAQLDQRFIGGSLWCGFGAAGCFELARRRFKLARRSQQKI